MRMWLRERVLWWRCFLPVVFSHKPLCGQFHGHNVTIGGWHLCRSCLLLYAGAVLTAVLICARPQALVHHRYGFVALVVLTLLLSTPAVYRRYPRPVKDVLRFLLGVSGAGAAGMLVVGPWRTGVVLAALLVGAKQIFSALRARNRDRVCQNCPEFHQRGICSGFRLKSRRMRLYERGLERFRLIPSRNTG